MNSRCTRGAFRWYRLVPLALALAALGPSSSAAAQPLAVNYGHGIQLRFFNGSRWDGAAERNVGQTNLVVNTLIEGVAGVPVLVTLEQGGRVLASAGCETQWITDQSEGSARVARLRECATERIDAANIRANQPVEIAFAAVNPVTDARSEFYRGTFPVIAFYEWNGNANGRPVYVEQRALRLDSTYGAGFLFQDGPDVDFRYVTTAPTEELPDEHSMRCRVGSGEWVVYETSLSRGNEQDLVNRVHVDEYTLAEENQSIHTQFVEVSVKNMPIAVAGRDYGPRSGSSLDGAWTCELRTGGAGSRIVEREFRFDVANGFIRSHAIASQMPAGHGSAIVAIGFNPAALPMIFDPALVRDTVAGRRLTGAAAPVVAGMPSRAKNPELVTPRGGASAGRGGRRR